MRSQYGRAKQSRVANVLFPRAGPHNIVAKEQEKLAEDIFSELEDISTGVTPEQQTVILEARDTIQSEVQRAVQSGANRITITVPTVVGSIVVRLLRFVLGLAALGGFIAGIVTAPPIVAAVASLVGVTSYGIGGLAAYRGSKQYNRAREEMAARAAAEAASAQWRGTSTGAVPTAANMAENNPNGTPPAYYTRRNRRNA